MKYCFCILSTFSVFVVGLLFFFNMSAEQKCVHQYNLIHLKKKLTPNVFDFIMSDLKKSVS